MLEDLKKLSEGKRCTPERVVIGSALFLLVNIAEMLIDPLIQNLSSKNKFLYLGNIGNRVLREYIVADTLNSFKKTTLDPETLGMLDEIGNLANDIVSYCDQAGIGTRDDFAVNMRMHAQNLWSRFIDESTQV